MGDSHDPAGILAEFGRTRRVAVEAQNSEHGKINGNER